MGWYVPRSEFCSRVAARRTADGCTLRHDKPSVGALHKLALHARLFASVTTRACGQASELLVQRLRIFAVL